MNDVGWILFSFLAWCLFFSVRGWKSWCRDLEERISALEEDKHE